jgi:hypothetical protein
VQRYKYCGVMIVYFTGMYCHLLPSSGPEWEWFVPNELTHTRLF